MAPPGAEFRAAVLEYKYVSPTLSLLERLWLNEFWARVAERYPRWLAPNVISLVGYLCVLVAFANTMWGSPELLGALAGWQYVLNAALFFAYQTLDGSDGKQARRTGSGSALGELMDHGIDAVVTTMVTMLTVDVFAFGITSALPWAFTLVALLSFFLSNMTLVHSGRQMFFDLDVMEIQTVMILTLLAAGALGPRVFDEWSFPLPAALHGVRTDLGGLLRGAEVVDLSSGRLSVKLFVVLGGLAGCAFNYPQYLWASARPYLWLAPKDRPAHVQKAVTGTGLRALLVHLAVIHAFIALAALCVLRGTALRPHGRAVAAMQAFTLVLSYSFGDLMDRVLLMRVAREPLPLLPPGLLPLAAFALACGADAQLPYGWWWAVVALALAIHHSYWLSSVSGLAAVLNIHPLRITPKEPAPSPAPPKDSAKSK
jgi:ethanolaminephosphotransferase